MAALVAVTMVFSAPVLGCSAAASTGAERTRSVPDTGAAANNTPAGMPRIWMLAVGVSNYKDTSMTLQFADRDAAAIDDFFASQGGGSLPSDRRILLVNEEATRAAVLTALSTLSKRTAPEDMIVLFLAMHGIPDPGGDLYYLTYDTDPRQLIGTGLPQRDIEYAVGRAQAKRVVLLADACHAGAAGFDGFRSRRGAMFAETNRLVGELAQSKPGTAVLTASTATETSVEGERWGGGHGAFTHYLLKGLEGAADTNSDRFVTIRELFDFVYQNVSRDTAGAQHPELKGSFDNRMPLSELPEALAGGRIVKGSAGAPVEDTTPLVTRERKADADALADECRKDQWASCSILGAMHAAGEGVAFHAGKAIDLLERGCDGGDGPGCFGLATLYEGGRLLKRDPAKAAELFQKSCDAGHGSGCRGLARRVAAGQGATADKPRAQSLFRKAVTLDEERCRERDAGGCHALAQALIDGAGIAADPARARSLLGRACDAGLARSCDLAAQLAGHGTAAARKLLERACDGDLARSCTLLSSLYFEPTGKEPDPSRALSLQRRACELAQVSACRTCVALGEGDAHDMSAAASCLQQACDLGDLSSCMTAAGRYENGEPPFGYNPVLAAILYGRVCVTGNRLACKKRDALRANPRGRPPPRR